MAAKKKSLAKRKSSTALAKPTGDLMDQLNRQKATIKVSGGGNGLRVQGSNFFLGEDNLGEEINAVILEAVYEHRWFEGEYDPDVIAPPDCFALGLDQEELEPHDKSQNKQAETCGECEFNRFGSGRGGAKACQNRVRLSLLPADNANDKDIDEAEVFTLFVPPTSLKAVKEYISMVNNKLEVPTSLVVTTITAEPTGTYSHLIFEYDSPLKAPAAFQKKLVNKVIQSREQMLIPYEPIAEENAKPKSKGRAKKKTTRRKSRLS